MRPVNLLPERHRPRAPTGSREGSSYAVLAALALLFVGVTFYIVTLNSINSSKDKIATANAEAARANAEAAALGPYGDFAKVKDQRVAAVTQLAGGRFDFERLVHELSYVLPDGVWLRTVNAADSAGDAQATSSAASGASAAAGAGSSNPTLQLDGCAPSQARVAIAMVRLRELQGATDVTLEHSTQPDQQGSSGGVSAPGGGSSAGGGSGGGCATSSGHANYEFAVDVTFAPIASAVKAAPPWLGGGA